MMMKPWIYDEYRHCGVNYADKEEVEKFEAMPDFLERRTTQGKHTVDLDYGTGTRLRRST